MFSKCDFSLERCFFINITAVNQIVGEVVDILELSEIVWTSINVFAKVDVGNIMVEISA